MKLSIWKQPGALVPASADSLRESFDKKLGALRAATGRPERFVTRCACAIHDKGFVVVYARTDPARPFIIIGIYKDGEGDAGGAAGALRSRAVAHADVDSTGWRCPYCGMEGLHIQCTGCHTIVCSGKTRRYPGTSDIFECRASCGCRGTLEATASLKGFDAVRPSQHAGVKPLRDLLSAPTSNVPRLDGPKGPRIK